jgi:hypothetical protein
LSPQTYSNTSAEWLVVRQRGAGTFFGKIVRAAVASHTLVLLFTGAATAQVSGEIATVTHSEGITGRPVTITVGLHQAESIARVYLRYRSFTHSVFNTLEMDLVRDNATTAIPAEDVLPPFLDYYLILEYRDGSFMTDPPGGGEDPFSTPPPGTLQIPVTEPFRAESVLFLSPDPDDRVTAENLVIAVSLLRADSTVFKPATQLLIDGNDAPAGVVRTDDLLLFVPSNVGLDLDPGSHTITVRLFDVAGSLVDESTLEFDVAGERRYAPEKSPEFNVTGSAQVESRHEDIANTGTWYNRANIRLRGMLEEWAVVGNMFVTSDEEPDRQPQNRFFGGIESPWLQLGYGDAYPVFPSLIMSGKRIRGFNGRAEAGPQVFMVAAGETDRGIEGRLLETFPAESLSVKQQSNPGAAFGPLDNATWGRFSYGTYERNLLVLRTETRLGRTGGIGISALKGKDDIGSIAYGIRPRENLVVGLDAHGSYDNRGIELAAQAAFSAYNGDISSGSFTDAYIDSTYESNASEIKDVRDVLDDFITVNDNLRPLSFKHFPTVAYELSAGLNYFRNAVKVAYIYRGSDYTSFGQTYIRTDIQGVTAADRISLADNQILLSIGYEHLKDNTSKSKVATTTFRTVTGALSFFPRQEGPSVTIGFGHYGSSNGISPIASDSLLAIDDEDNRIYLQSAHDFTWHAKHTASLSLSTSTRTDRSPRRLDVDNTTASLRLASRFHFPLETTADLFFSFNRLPSAVDGTRMENDYTTLSLGALYRLMDDRLRLEARISPTFGDVDRTVWDLGSSYAVIERMTLQLRFTLFAIPVLADDSIWSMVLRYDL